MDDASRQRYLQIQLILTKFLSEIIEVPEDTLFFAASTYGFNAEDFAAAVNDRVFEERELLIDMLLFPTQKLREKLEPILVAGSLVDADVQWLVEAIVNEAKCVTARLPVGDSFSFEIGCEAISNFVGKLYLTREPCQLIAKGLREGVPEEIATRLSVFMRCRNLSFSAEAQQIFLTFTEKAAHQQQDFEGLAELLLTVTSQVPPGMTVVDHLFEQREYHKKLLYEIEEFRQKSEQYGMEYLMMQNYPVPHESAENVAELLRKYRVIIEEILNLQNRKQHYLNRQDLGSFDTEKDLAKLFRSLS